MAPGRRSGGSGRSAAIEARILVGEDVVDLDLAAAALPVDAADVRPLAVRPLEVVVRRRPVLVVVVPRLVLGKPEVDEAPVPHVTSAHVAEGYRDDRPYSTEPSRTMVAPSSTATAKSCDVPIESVPNAEATGPALVEPSRPARAGLRSAGATSRGRRRAGGIVISPWICSRSSGAHACEERVEVGERTPRLLRLAGHVDLDQAGDVLAALAGRAARRR